MISPLNDIALVMRIDTDMMMAANDRGYLPTAMRPRMTSPEMVGPFIYLPPPRPLDSYDLFRYHEQWWRPQQTQEPARKRPQPSLLFFATWLSQEPETAAAAIDDDVPDTIQPARAAHFSPANDSYPARRHNNRAQFVNFQA